jgi:hypothetical protein
MLTKLGAVMRTGGSTYFIASLNWMSTHRCTCTIIMDRLLGFSNLYQTVDNFRRNYQWSCSVVCPWRCGVAFNDIIFMFFFNYYELLLLQLNNNWNLTQLGYEIININGQLAIVVLFVRLCKIKKKTDFFGYCFLYEYKHLFDFVD